MEARQGGRGISRGGGAAEHGLVVFFCSSEYDLDAFDCGNEPPVAGFKW